MSIICMWKRLGRGVCGGLLALALLASCSGSSSPEEAQEQVQGEDSGEQSSHREVNVEVQDVAPAEVRDVVVLPGSAEAWKEVVLSAETSGRVEKLLVDEGDAVHQGQVLAHIDVTALNAVLNQAQARLDLLQDQLRRRENLFAREIIAEEELDHIRAEHIQAQEALRHARIEYQRGVLRAPLSGRVNRLQVEAGEFVDRGHAMVDVVNIDRLKFQVQVPEMDVRFMRVGQSTRVVVDAFPELELQGKTHFVAYKGDSATKTFRVEVVVDNDQGLLRPGMIAKVAFVRRIIPETVAIPLSALIDRGGERLVYVLEDGKARAREVEIGVIEKNRVQITSGLDFGDRLIVTGQRQVDDGMAVAVR